MPNIAVFASGNGTNFEAILDATLNGVIRAKVALLVCNDPTANVIKIAEKHNVNVLIEPYHFQENRDEYYKKIYQAMMNLNDDIHMIVLAGWMLILTETIIGNMNESFGNVINLHPALPAQFAGANAIAKAWEKFEKGEIQESGVMVHHVVPEVDAGEVIEFKVVPIIDNDTFETFNDRMRYFEKPTLISAINKILQPHTNEFTYQRTQHCIQMALNCDDKTQLETELFIKGKVRDCLSIKNSHNGNRLNFLVINHSDRLSAFNKHICHVEGKGNILMLQNIWWMHQTRHIIPNHYICHLNNSMLVQLCNRIPIEVVVRGYITGSMWSHYNSGSRTFCGNELPEGLTKNQKLEKPIITPTTKDDEDRPITSEEIVSTGLLTQEQWDFVCRKALELFEFGQIKTGESGLILVDTKYEFGFNAQGDIILVDEIHTSDSSRYWIDESYESNIHNGQEPEKLDKDAIRDWLKTQGDPTSPNYVVPEIPTSVKESVFSAYSQLYKFLTGRTSAKQVSGDDFSNGTQYCMDQIIVQSPYKVIIISGSNSDKPYVDKIVESLSREKLISLVHYASAHRQTQNVIDILQGYKIIAEKTGHKFVFVAVAGMSDALAGVVAANVKFPTIACPPFKDHSDYLTNVHSTLQAPKGVPVMTSLSPENVAISCAHIFSICN